MDIKIIDCVPLRRRNGHMKTREITWSTLWESFLKRIINAMFGRTKNLFTFEV
jgi:hypothetical protein